MTHFVASGRAPRTTVELLNPARPKSWGSCVVVAKVTQNDDPEGMGRVRVTYPGPGQPQEQFSYDSTYHQEETHTDELSRLTRRVLRLIEAPAANGREYEQDPAGSCNDPGPPAV